MNEMKDAGLIDGEREIKLALEIRAAIEAQEILQAVDRDPDLTLTSFTGISRECLEKTLRRGYEAKEDFIKANLRLVVSVAKRFAISPVDMIDLIQSGNIALIDAVDKYDPDLGNKFSTFAYARIFSAMQRAEADQGRTIHIPDHQLRKIKSYRRIRAEVESDNPFMDVGGIRVASADRLQLSVEELYDLEKDEYMLKLPASLDAIVGEHGRMTLGDMIGADDRSSITAQNNTIDFEELIEGLDDSGAEIIRLRYIETRTLQEITEILKISRQRVQQIEARALYKIRCRILRGEYPVEPEDHLRLTEIVARERARREKLVKPRPFDHPWLDKLAREVI